MIECAATIATNASIDVTTAEKIRASVRGNVEVDAPMRRHVTFRIGGPADFYVEPEDEQDAVALFNVIREERLPWVLIGNGSNVLISDEGIRGVVVNLEKGFRHLRCTEGKITAGSGVKLSRFVDFAINNGFGGAEMLAGIPGTLGGAVIMNAGAYGGEISDHIREIELIRNGELKRIQKVEGGFSYRASSLQNDIVLEATFEFPESTPEPMKVRRKELLVKRNASQPVNWPNAGSIFKNPPGDYAARLIEVCGLKGTRRGGAEVSQLHANFIINVDDASAHDVLALMEIVRDDVARKENVWLEPEIKLLGFTPDQLRQLATNSDVN